MAQAQHACSEDSEDRVGPSTQDRSCPGLAGTAVSSLAQLRGEQRLTVNERVLAWALRNVQIIDLFSKQTYENLEAKNQEVGRMGKKGNV